MDKTYEIYLVSDSTGETLDRIFLALQAQFSNFKYKSHQYAFTRTKNQIMNILEICNKNNLLIIPPKIITFAADKINIRLVINVFLLTILAVRCLSIIFLNNYPC